MMDERDQLFDQQIHDAYDSIRLDAAAEDRMLANLLVAQKERELVSEPGDVTEAQPTVVRSQGAPAHMRTQKAQVKTAVAPRKRGWRVVLPLAAVLLVAVVVLRVTAMRPKSEAIMAPSSLTSSKDEAVTDSAVAEGAAEAPGAIDYEEAAPLADEESYEVALEESEEGDLGAKTLQSADWYPRITLGDDTMLTTLIDGKDTVEVAANRVGSSVGPAKAQPFDSAETVSCEVFKLTDDANAYAVRYEGEDSYWYCVPL